MKKLGIENLTETVNDQDAWRSHVQQGAVALKNYDLTFGITLCSASANKKT